MNQQPSPQQIFFQQIKAKLPENLSLVHEIAEFLGLSYDSAYRRIRGEKELTMEELCRLGQKFGISLDALLGLKTDQVVFKKYALQPGKYSIKDWLKRIREDIRMIHSASQKEIIYAAKDPPLFHHFQFPEIAAFKFFFWEKTILNFPEYENKQFRIDDADPEIVAIGNDILRAAIKIPTTELWNEDTFNIFMKQIEHYWISGYFARKDDMLNLMDKLEKWVRHIHKQAEVGFKFIYGQTEEGINDSFCMYENEVVLNDNTIFVRIGEHTGVYVTFNVISLLNSRDEKFCTIIENHMRQLMKKSNLISQSGEKARNRFFNKLLHTIEKAKADLDIY
jgi:plasmid maintenance system antidote protein VapI